MGKGAFINLNGTAKKIKSIYFGINGIARKIKKVYVGVNGVAKQVFSSGKLVVHPTTAMTSESSNGYIATCSEHNSSTYAAWHAFDKDIKKGWASKNYSTNNSPYIQLQLPKALNILKITIVNREHSSYVNGIINANIYGSNVGLTADNSLDTDDFTRIKEISGRNGEESGYSSEHDCSSTNVKFQYIIINPTKWTNYNSNANSYVAIGEIYITCLEEE